MSQRAERWDFKVVYTRNGTWHRWRLFTYGVQINTGQEQSDREARKSANTAKTEYRLKYEQKD